MRLFILTAYLVISSLSFLSPIHGQQGNTTFARIINNSTTSQATVVPSQYMVGQPFHVATAIFSQRTGQTCTSVIGNAFSIPSLSILASYDNLEYIDITNYVRVITPLQTSSTNVYRMIGSAAGAFPYIKLSISNWNTTQCQVTIYYSGSQSGLDIKKYTDYGTIADPTSDTSIAITGTGDTTIVGAVPQGRVAVYALTLTGPTLANDTCSLVEIRTDTSRVTHTQWHFTGNEGNAAGNVTGNVIALPNTNFPLFVTSPGSSLVMHCNGAGGENGSLQYRIE